MPLNFLTSVTTKPQHSLTHHCKAGVKAEEQTSTFALLTSHTLQISAKNVQTNTVTQPTMNAVCMPLHLMSWNTNLTLQYLMTYIM